LPRCWILGEVGGRRERERERGGPRRCTGDKIYGVVRLSLRQAATSFTPIQPPRSLRARVFRFTSNLRLISPPFSSVLSPPLATESTSENQHGNVDRAAMWKARALPFDWLLLIPIVAESAASVAAIREHPDRMLRVRGSIVRPALIPCCVIAMYRPVRSEHTCIKMISL